MGLGTLLLWAGLAMAGEGPVNIGAPALQFSLTAVNEPVAMDLVNKPTVALSDFAGVAPSYARDAVVLYFFDRRAGGDALASVERVARKYRGKNVQIVGILVDEAPMATLSEWVLGAEVSFPVLRDGHRLVAGRYGLDKLPVTYVLDGQGDVFAVGTPKAGSIESELESAIDAVLEDPQ